MKTISKELAEILGIILGDGHIHTIHNTVTIVGSLEDKEYYERRVIPLFEKVFLKKPTLKRRKDRNAFYLSITCKKMMNELLSCGLQRGSKKKARVPFVIEGKKELIKCFLRGLFDTDGCLKFSKQTKNINYYPRIQIALQHSPLAYDIGNLLSFLGLNYGCWEGRQFSGLVYYQVSGKEKTHEWFKKISPKNYVQISKYDYWKKYGFYIPKSTLKERMSSLAQYL